MFNNFLNILLFICLERYEEINDKLMGNEKNFMMMNILY